MIVEEAEILCVKAHDGQFRKDGVTPYYTHPFAVADMMTTDEEKVVALLHDVIEDTEATLELNLQSPTNNWVLCNNIQYHITIEQAVAIHLITKQDEQLYNDYIYNIGNVKLAAKVKIADMFHNISSNPSEKQKAKYYKAIKYLLSTL